MKAGNSQKSLIEIHPFQFLDGRKTKNTLAVAVKLSAGKHNGGIGKAGKFCCAGKSGCVNQIGLIRKTAGKHGCCTSGVQENGSVPAQKRECLFSNFLFLGNVADRFPVKKIICANKNLYRFGSAVNADNSVGFIQKL